MQGKHQWADKIAVARAAATCQKTLAFTALDGARYARLFVAVQILVQRCAPFLFKKLAKFCGGRIAFSEVLAVLLPQRAYERVAAFLPDRAVLVAMATIESVFFFSHGKYSTEKSHGYDNASMHAEKVDFQKVRC